MDPRLKACSFQIAVDVENKLVGKQGATYVYGPQKGVNSADLPILDEGMKQYTYIIKRDLGLSISDVLGAGAAGGIGAACIAFLNGEISKGIDIALEKTAFKEHIEGADLIVTGEGKLDAQTMYGKVITGVMKLAQKYEVPVIAIAGMVEEGIVNNEAGFTAIYSLVAPAISTEEAMENAATLTESTAKIAFQQFLTKEKAKRLLR